jgi:multidrug efflux pump subunit AcrA (membrane-fusion protein)
VDKPREKPKGFSASHLGWSVIALAAGAVLFYFASTDFTTTRIKRESVTLATVERGEFTVTVFANGLLKPREIEWIAAQVNGTVSRIAARPGDFVEQGQVIVELANPSLVNQAREAEMALQAARANLKALEVSLQGQKVNQEAELAIAALNQESAQLRFTARAKLFKTDNPIISRLDYEQSRLDAEQSRILHEVEKKRLAQIIQNINAQIDAETFRVSQLEQAYRRAAQLADQLVIKAGMTGVVQALPVEIGQHLLQGSEISRIARQDDLYAELKVSPRQATDVQPGQVVEIDTLNGKIEGRVSRVDPSVIEGRVLVDVELVSMLPASARPDLNVNAIISVASIEDTLFVKKPYGGRRDSRSVVYVLNEENNYADRQKVSFGQASSERIEIVSGLAPGNQIILSDSSNWNDNPRIYLN